MKRIFSLLIALIIVSTAFVACGTQTPKENDYTLSIGVAVTETLAKNKIAETAAAIITDADGKIVLCRIDCVEYTAAYGEDGSLSTTAPTSKFALGDNYAMPSGSWAKQTAAFESYVIGKTQDEVAKIALEGGKATDAELVASCTFDITDLIKAVNNAFKSSQKISFKSSATEFKAGFSVVSAVKDSSTDDSKNAKFTATYSAAITVNDTVILAIMDCAEADLIGVSEEGSASLSFAGTKREQGDTYIMTSGAWYAQADAYAASAVGKTAADIDGLAIEGVAGCTMPYSVYDFKAGLEAAVKGAR